MVSRMKALAGMSESVRQGLQGGGRAPFGYRLEHIPAGTMRDRAPVTKSRLVTTADAERIEAYLKERAEGRPHTREFGLANATTSFIGIVWNALTYAGCTVWNANQERLDFGGYEGGQSGQDTLTEESAT